MHLNHTRMRNMDILTRIKELSQEPLNLRPDMLAIQGILPIVHSLEHPNRENEKVPIYPKTKKNTTLLYQVSLANFFYFLGKCNEYV